MAAAAVAWNGVTRSSGKDSDSNTGWGNYVIGGGAPSSEAQLAYQGSGAVNKKITSSSARQGVDYNHTGSVDMTTAANRLWFCKVIVSDSFDLNTTWGIEVAIGSGDNSNKHVYNIAGSGSNLSVYSNYPVQGGYIITSIDPTVDTWRESETGTLLQTAVIWWAVGAQFVTGAAKTENVAMDAIDIGTGLTITAGDGGGTEGDFLDFVAYDQDTSSNRYGVVTGSGGVVRAHGILTIGTASVTEFLDTASIVLFPDGYHGTGLVGVAVGNSHASSIIQIDSLLIGEGTINGGGVEDTRPDFIVTGTSGTFSCAATMRNFRNVTFQSDSTVDGADIECQLLTQNSADIENSTIRTNSLTSVACLISPTFGASTDLHDVDFIQSGVGHAIELSGVDATYTLTNITFTGYGADDTADAALDVTAGSGTTTINHTGTQPTRFKTGGVTVVFVSSVNVTVTIKDSDGVVIPGVEVAIFQDNAARTVVLASTSTDESGQVATTAATSLGAIIIRVRQSANTASFDATSGGVDVGTEIITTDAVHNFQTGDAVVYDANGETAVTGITDTNTYYVRYQSTTTLTLHDTAAGAIADTGVRDLTIVGTGTQKLNPVRYINNSASGTIETGDFSTTITMTADTTALDT